MAVLSTSTAVGLTAAVVLAAAGGTSMVAETATPGDVLYPVKTEVNEPVAGSLALTTTAEASWEATLALRRLAEAEELASENALTSNVRATLQNEFETHANNATELAAQATDNGDADTSAEVMTDFHTRLDAEADTIHTMNIADSAVRTQLDILHASVQTTKNAVKEHTVSSSSDSTVESKTETETKTETDVDVDANGDSDTQQGATIDADTETKIESSIDNMLQIGY